MKLNPSDTPCHRIRECFAASSFFLPLRPQRFLYHIQKRPRQGQVYRRNHALRSQLVETPTTSREVLVVGAGVIGLTTAIRLREAGHKVTVIAEETPKTIFDRSHTPWESNPKGTYTSSGSGGFWMPFALEGEEIENWATKTYYTLQSHIEENVGVSAMDALYLYARGEPVIPWYADLTNLEVVDSQKDKRVPIDYRCALKFKTLVVQMDLYLIFLESCLKDIGVPIHSTREFSKPSESALWDMPRVSEFAKSMAPNTIVVNCAGIGARFLADEDLIPGRGIILRVQRPPEVNYVITEDPYDAILSRDGLLAYAIPRGDEISLGGTLFKGDWNEEASDEEIAAVRSRAEQLLPIKGMAETARWSGLRPLRLDGTAKVEKDSRNLISNYGHGGSGVTICWGCAERVVNLVAREA
ncbi:unnamed protein product [Agarophyton chilense]